MKLVLILTFTILSTLFTPVIDSPNSDSFPVMQSLNTCPANNDLTYANVELFISHPDWSDNRTATGTNGLSVSQLQVLSDGQHSSVCQYFNSEYSDTINKTSQPDNDPTYHVTYYKAGSFYFVSIVLAQPSNTEYVAVGLSFIIVYDNSLNLIKGYSF